MAALLSLVAAHLLLAMFAGRRTGITTDEPVEIAGGLALLTRGEMRINVEHPPLVKALAALPLLATNLRIDPADPDYQTGRQWLYARKLLFHGGVDADRIVHLCRTVTILFSLLLATSIFLVARKLYGEHAALLSLLFYALDPNFLGHAAVVQFDVALSLFIFAATCSFQEFLLTRSRRQAILAGLCFGLGLGSKFTSLTIPIIWLFLMILHRKSVTWKILPDLLVVFAISSVALGLCYGFVLLPDFFRGLVWQEKHALRGHTGYLFGSLKQDGSPLYFPATFLFKTPVETLALFLCSLPFVSRDRRSRGLVLGSVVFFCLILPSSINIGHRYMLPCYPFLFVVSGSAVRKFQGWQRAPGSRQSGIVGLALLLGAFLALRTLLVFPDYLGFTNMLAGKQPERLIADSNIDWGQDLPKLADWMTRNGVDNVKLAYSGMDDPGYRRISFTKAPCREEPGLYAVSINCLLGILPASNRDCYTWPAKNPVKARIGTSMLVIEVP